MHACIHREYFHMMMTSCSLGGNHNGSGIIGGWGCCGKSQALLQYWDDINNIIIKVFSCTQLRWHASIIASELFLSCGVHACSLSHNSIDDAGIQALAEGIKHCPLEKLKWANSYVVESTLSLLIGFCLKIYSFGDNRVGNHGARALADCLKHFANMKELK